MNGFPIQSAKVQRPPLRDDVLARDRLLDWLHVKIHHRLVLVLAEAGYGKTTLLADFAGRTRLRTLWYRLDEDDRDWVTLLHHLVASGREHDPAFASRTAAMLADSGVSGPSRDVVLDMFMRELGSIAAHGAVLILDDLHLVDDAPDAKVVVRELVARAPERVSIVIASRRAPSISIAKLRGTGEVAELRTDDLRFDASETARLFSESYGRPLEADVLAELSARTEGWAASLQLVQAALRDRSPAEIRRFVRNLTGADQELYDYLAEEVVGELPEQLQQFLMQTSILQVVRPDLAAAVTGLAPAEVRALTATAERFSLLGRRGSSHRDQLRYHPLVRDFLESRLERSVADRSAVSDLHRLVAASTEGRDWRVACHHYAAIGDEAGVIRTIDGAVEDIVARGDVLVAEGFLTRFSGAPTATSHEVVRSRSERRRGQYAAALDRAERASTADPTSAVALANLASIAYQTGDLQLSEQAATALASLAGETSLRAIGASLVTLIRSSVDASIPAGIEAFERLRASQAAVGHTHHEATSLLNLAILHRVMANPSAVLEATGAAIALLAPEGSTAELASVYAVRAWAFAHKGDLVAASELMDMASTHADELTGVEVTLERAEVELWYGSIESALDLLDQVGEVIERYAVLQPFYAALRAQAEMRNDNVGAATVLVHGFQPDAPSVIVGFKAQELAIQAHLATLTDSPDRDALLDAAARHAALQGADFWTRYVRTLSVLTRGPTALNREIRRVGGDGCVYLSIHGELVARHISALGPEESGLLLNEMQRRPERWRSVLRVIIDSGERNAASAGQFLEVIGGAEDVARLRRLSKDRASGAPSDLGRQLARTLAARVDVEDQGRVALRVGRRHVEGAAIRRKVLSLLCFLLTRPRFSATRDEVLDTLWPEFEPAVALNSLNQTLYFLRRVIEPDYREELSPGYVRHESDVVWLDRQLVSSRSQRCADLMKSLPAVPSPSEVERLVKAYGGRFALDFAYEDWAVAYRETLHASYLQIVEGALASDLATGHFERGITIARRALAVDPEADEIELSLLRLLRATGAHASAAEQYAHYAATLRGTLGIEPPPLETL